MELLPPGRRKSRLTLSASMAAEDEARGLFISYSEFTQSAITTSRDALAGGAVIVLAKLQEIVELLDRDGDVKQWLKTK